MAVMPCTAKKGEAARPEMRVGGGAHGGSSGGSSGSVGGGGGGDGAAHVDYVLTTRELGRMLRWVGGLSLPVGG